MVEHVERLLGVMEQHQADLKTSLEQQKQETEHQRQEMEAAKSKMVAKDAKIAELTPAAAITDEQLATLQARLEGLHMTKLLADEELFALEDLIADYSGWQMNGEKHVCT